MNARSVRAIVIAAVVMAASACDFATETVSSHSTSYHARFVETPQTYLIDKKKGETLTLELERQGGRAVIASVR